MLHIDKVTVLFLDVMPDCGSVCVCCFVHSRVIYDYWLDVSDQGRTKEPHKMSRNLWSVFPNKLQEGDDPNSGTDASDGSNSEPDR